MATAAAVVAVIMIVGGTYFVGFVSEVQRGLNDPVSANQTAASRMGEIEQALGYGGFLKAYRGYRLTGDVSLREQMNRYAVEATRNLDILRRLYRETPAARRALYDVNAVVETFSQAARTAPEMETAPLRGTPAMETLEALPQTPQLEATYLSLRSALERLRSQTQSHQLGGVAWALSWSQMLIVGTLALLALGLAVAAGLLHIGITQPLKSLETSLASVNDGQVTAPVWGTDRNDEIGNLARAGDRLRTTLTEQPALKELATKGEIHVRLDDGNSVLMEKLASGVSGAAEALKSATGELADMQEQQRARFEAAMRKFEELGSRFVGVTGEMRTEAAAAVAGVAQDMRSSLDRIITTAEERTKRLGQAGAEVEQNGRALSEVVSHVREKTGVAIDGITRSIVAFQKAAEGAQSIQGAFFAACDRISSDAAATVEGVRTLASQLEGAIGNVDARLSRKLDTLDRLEQGIEVALAGIQARTAETVQAVLDAAATVAAHSAGTGARVGETAEEFDEVLRLFREDGTAIQEETSRVNASIQEIERGIARITELQASEFRALAASVQDLGGQVQVLAARAAEPVTVTVPAPAPAPAFSHDDVRQIVGIFTDEHASARSDAAQIIAGIQSIEQRFDQTSALHASESRELADLIQRLGESLDKAPALAAPAAQQADVETLLRPLTAQLDGIRADLRDLALRMTEERIMLAADMPAAAIAQQVPAEPVASGRSLADIPQGEIMGRLKELAEEMNAPAPAPAPVPAAVQAPADPGQSLKTALVKFTGAVKAVSRSAEPAGTLRKLAQTFERHAEVIDECATAIAPSANALRTEIQSITRDLRNVARSAQDADATSATVLQETAMHLGARAESLFTYLDQVRPEIYQAARETDSGTGLEEATTELNTLAGLIGKLEERATAISDRAVSRTLEGHFAAPSPSEAPRSVAPASPEEMDTVIQTVFEAIDRLHNIATALARTNDAARNRRAAG